MSRRSCPLFGRYARVGFLVGATLVGCKSDSARECRTVILRVNANVDRATAAIAKLDVPDGTRAPAHAQSQFDDLVRVMTEVRADMGEIHVDDPQLRGHVERYAAMLDRMTAAAREVRAAAPSGDSKATELALKALAAAGRDEDALVLSLNAYCGTKAP